jgi:hypothetical protein
MKKVLSLALAIVMVLSLGISAGATLTNGTASPGEALAATYTFDRPTIPAVPDGPALSAGDALQVRVLVPTTGVTATAVVAAPGAAAGAGIPATVTVTSADAAGPSGIPVVVEVWHPTAGRDGGEVRWAITNITIPEDATTGTGTGTSGTGNREASGAAFAPAVALNSAGFSPTPNMPAGWIVGNAAALEGAPLTATVTAPAGSPNATWTGFISATGTGLLRPGQTDTLTTSLITITIGDTGSGNEGGGGNGAGDWTGSGTVTNATVTGNSASGQQVGATAVVAGPIAAARITGAPSWMTITGGNITAAGVVTVNWTGTAPAGSTAINLTIGTNTISFGFTVQGALLTNGSFTGNGTVNFRNIPGTVTPAEINFLRIHGNRYTFTTSSANTASAAPVITNVVAGALDVNRIHGIPAWMHIYNAQLNADSSVTFEFGLRGTLPTASTNVSLGFRNWGTATNAITLPLHFQFAVTTIHDQLPTTWRIDGMYEGSDLNDRIALAIAAAGGRLTGDSTLNVPTFPNDFTWRVPNPAGGGATSNLPFAQAVMHTNLPDLQALSTTSQAMRAIHDERANLRTTRTSGMTGTIRDIGFHYSNNNLNVRIRTPIYMIRTGNTDVNFDLNIAVTGAANRLIGTVNLVVGNDRVELFDNQEFIDPARTEYLRAEETIRSLEIYAGEGVYFRRNLTSGQSIYVQAELRTDHEPELERLFNLNAHLVDVIDIHHTGMNVLGVSARLTGNSVLYVWNAQGQPLGTTGTWIQNGFSTRYFLTSTNQPLNLGGLVPQPPSGEAPADDNGTGADWDGNPPMGGDGGASGNVNVNFNPGTGR